mmetsp:Transcript_29337/g.32932  ORF Transcript_29337/g.32932 Transcript_29337/m.32932 type:complete len:442 (+) Transcript_29337:57-1382(+)
MKKKRDPDDALYSSHSNDNKQRSHDAAASSSSSSNDIVSKKRNKSLGNVTAFLICVGLLLLFQSMNTRLSNYSISDTIMFTSKVGDYLYRDPGNSLPESPPFYLELETICSNRHTSSSSSSNNKLPPRELLSMEDIRDVVKYWYKFNCPLKQTCILSSLGQHLLHAAIQQNKTMLTVQIGAMDGRSNDPMYSMFIKHNKYTNHIHRNNNDPLNLNHWLPVLFEPVPSNFDALTKTYDEIIQSDSGLGCAVPVHAAVSYDGMAEDKNNTSGECKFCRMNTADDAPDKCKSSADWMKYQLGSLDCDAHKRFFNIVYDLCILESPLPCATLQQLLARYKLMYAPIAMLQIDIEGLEYLLFDGLIQEMPDHLLPLVIHYEHKVMKARDITANSMIENFSRYNHTKSMLQSRGYVLHNQGEDYLALRVADGRQSNSSNNNSSNSRN